MDTDDDIQLHGLETIEQNLSVDKPQEHATSDGFMMVSASGFMMVSASGFMMV
jgi:hypothetical protein